MAIEHRVALFYKSRPGGRAKFMRIFSAWAILFGSKLVMLEAIDIAFGHRVAFNGAFHGVVAFVVVVIAMVIAEEAVARFVRVLR